MAIKAMVHDHFVLQRSFLKHKYCDKMKVVIQVKVLLTDQSRRLEVFDDGVLSDWQMELIPTQNEPVVDGVTHQVDAGSHDKSDDADVDCWARQHLWTALNQLMTDMMHFLHDTGTFHWSRFEVWMLP